MTGRMTRATAAGLMKAAQFGKMELEPPLIVVSGEITQVMADRIVRQMSVPMTGGDLCVIVDSPGGSLIAADRIYDAIRGHHGRIATKALALCCSAALHVMLAGDIREARRGCKFLLHDAEILPDRGDEIRWTARAHRATADMLEKADARLAALYADRTGKAAARFRAEMATEAGISAERALGLGIIHRVL